ncbi:Ff.00g112050.m01.CDS01 [Fusarium sp. VM40]|nr:Ff.00g112050.m01.CDS01 [Fusarium sp. VM40]
MTSFTPINLSIKKTSSKADENKNEKRNSSSSMSKSTNSVRLQPWQLRALQNGRNPLPEAPGARPCIDPRASSHVVRSQSSNPPSSIDVLSSSGTTNTDEASGTEATSMTYRFWSGNDMRSLIALRNSGATWPDVYAAFPERTPEAIKQAYHKRRHTIEREMVMEAEAASNSQSNGNGGMNN